MGVNAQIVDQRLRRLVEEQREPLTAQIGRADPHRLLSATFVFLVLKSVLDLADDEAVDGITDGSGDFGIDAVCIGPVQDGEMVVTLVQGKYTQDLDKDPEFPQGGIEQMEQAIRLLFDPKVALTVNPRLAARIEDVRSLIAEGVIPRVHAILCNNGRKWNAAADEVIQAAQRRFGEQVSWQHVGPDDLVRLLSAHKRVDDQIALTGQAVIEDFPNFRRALIGRMDVGQLANLFDRHGDRLLERNIRRYLGLAGNRVNEAIQQTLLSGDSRSDFYFYNNGITIICNKFRVNQLARSDWQVRLEGLQIVNGGQTSKTVERVVKDHPEAAQAQVLIRIYELPEDDRNLVLNITLATNSQNPVDLRDLRSNDDRQRKLDMAISALGYTYRRQRGDAPASPKDLTSATVAESVLAVWRHRPHQARFNAGEHFGKLYDTIFSDHMNGAQAVAACLLQRVAENKRKRPPADAPEFLPYASRVIAMMMGRYLLAEMGIGLAGLDHRNFAQAEGLIERKGEEWFVRATEEIGTALQPFSLGQPWTLQRLSAQFRRADLVERLLGAPLTAQDGVSLA